MTPFLTWIITTAVSAALIIPALIIAKHWVERKSNGGRNG